MEGKKVARAALTVAGIGLAGYALLVLGDLATFGFAYWSGYHRFQYYGMQEWTAKMLAVVFALGFAYNFYWFVSAILRRDKQWMPRMAIGMFISFVVMFWLTAPYASGTYDVFSGQPSKYYRDQYNEIHKAPEGMKVGPNGEPVYQFDQKTGQEYERQEKTKVKKSAVEDDGSGLLSRVKSILLSSRPPDPVLITGFSDPLDIRIDKIEVGEDATVLFYSVGPNSTGADLCRPSQIYLTDDHGVTYDLSLDSVAYRDYILWGLFGNSTYSAHHVRAGEVYHYFMAFAPLKSWVKELKLHVQQEHVNSEVEENDLTKLFASADRLTLSSVGQAHKKETEEAEAARKAQAELMAKQQAENAANAEAQRKAEEKALERAQVAAKETAEEPAPVRVGGTIGAPIKLKDVRPVYPSSAQLARVQGVVVIEAIIGTDGSVREAKVLQSIPMLDSAALDAVKQWMFTPTLQEGVPVPVIMTVTVNFTLS